LSDLTAPTNGWTSFWNRGGWWKALLAAVGYLVLYNGSSALIGIALRGHMDLTDTFGSSQAVFFALLSSLTFALLHASNLLSGQLIFAAAAF
jgi:hypothetical protein